MAEPLPLTARDRRELIWFLLLALLLLAAGIGLRDPWPADEPRFVLVARQMFESGDWLFPHRGSELYSDKPPVMFWLMGLAHALVRNWRVAFLLPSLAAGMATLALTWDLGRRLWNPRAGLYSAIAVLFAFQFLYQVKRAQIDPLVMGWITLANWGLLLHCLRGPNWRAYWLGCFAAGVGVITKGVGVLALLMLLPYGWARVRGWDGVTRTRGEAGRWALGAVAFLAPILLWGGAVLIAASMHGTAEYAGYVDDLFLRQTAGRYARSWAHVQPVWYFLPVVLFNWLPLSLAYPAALPRWWHALRAREPRVMLPLAWSLLLLVFFSIPSGKRDVYLMPALPMVALSIAPWWQQIVASRWLRLGALMLTLAIGLLCLVVGSLAWGGHLPAAQKFLAQRELGADAHLVWGVVIAVGAGFVAAAALLRLRGGVVALLAGSAWLWLLIGFVVQPVLNDSSSAAGLMRAARELAGPGVELGLVAWKEQNLLMAVGPVRDFGFRAPWQQQYTRAAQWLAVAPQQRRIFILEDAMRRMGRCVDTTHAQYIGHANRREWWLLGADAVVPGCVPAADPAAAADEEADP